MLVTGNLQNCADVKHTSHGPKDARNRIKLHRAPACSGIFASPELKCELRAKPELIAGEDIVSSTSANIFTVGTGGNERRIGRTARLNHNLRPRLHPCCPPARPSIPPLPGDDSEETRSSSSSSSGWSQQRVRRNDEPVLEADFGFKLIRIRIPPVKRHLDAAASREKRSSKISSEIMDERHL